MQYEYPNNTNNTSITYFRERTGPNFFRVFYKNAAQIRYTPKEVGRVFGIAKFTPGVNVLREWCYEMIKEYGSASDKEDEDYLKYIEKNGFGPEVHGKEEDTHDGTKNTRMII
tara:strand:- start:233 stop:571 length:339 start_codon:yes stop_codon:yes gene_type:complete